MERFCNKCGSLVSGDGVFCPNCGEKLDSAVDLGKPATEDMMPTVSSTPVSSNSVGTTNTVYGATNTTNTTTTASNMGGYQGQMPNYGAPVYPQSTGNSQDAEMTPGKWALTIFLSCLGIIGIILLFVWAFGSDTPPNKRNYARGMLIYYAITIGASIVLCILTVACVGCAAGGLEGFFDEINNMDMDYYAAISNLFIK